MRQEFELAYGQGKVRFSIPQKNLLGLLRARALAALPHPQEEVRKALRNPTQCPPLAKTVSPGEKVGIVVPDKTRVSKADIIIPVILEELLKSGISMEDIFIVFANGTHPLHTRKEQEAIVGRDVASKVRLVDHDCRDQSNLTFVGTTTRGTRVELNRQLMEADRIILTGVITYHYFAGFGGGRKSILPGVASFETIQANHKLVLGSPSTSGMSKKAKTAILEGNPIHEDMEEAALMASPDFLVNLVLSDQKEIAGVFAGDLVAAHRKGCNYIDQNYRIGVEAAADVVIVSGGGYPKDMNFVQSHKAMDNAVNALRQGGTVILLAEAAEGFPSPAYKEWIDLKTLDAIEQGLRSNFSIPGHTVYSAINKAHKFNIIWVSGQDPEEVKKMSMVPAVSIEEALNVLQMKMGEDWRAYVMLEGYTTYPYLET